MDNTLEKVVAALKAAAEAGADLYAKIQAGEVVISETDAAKVHEALLAAEAATAALRPQVDAALQAAAARG